MRPIGQGFGLKRRLDFTLDVPPGQVFSTNNWKDIKLQFMT